ncbi:hypothetical protein DQ04_16461010 [Trypanosoma grayi]|uniref:hypothetical protein n=1 Tax=Trypanosoma grayi TaxID=71804 RepID=UPI0004F4A258|nr:hypothetical protein DQ04_16461010 [Trypanosoma grayi]KEG06023.1 hypothetical protein DQ04_16461010 [Trypanosoma grayi]
MAHGWWGVPRSAPEQMCVASVRVVAYLAASSAGVNCTGAFLPDERLNTAAPSATFAGCGADIHPHCGHPTAVTAWEAKASLRWPSLEQSCSSAVVGAMGSSTSMACTSCIVLARDGATYVSRMAGSISASVGRCDSTATTAFTEQENSTRVVPLLGRCVLYG